MTTLTHLLLESVAAARSLPSDLPGPLLDLGTGAGIPGLALALCRPDLTLHLLDRRARACAFLRREILALGLERVQVLEGPAETWARREDRAGIYALVLLKAVAPPPAALALARPFLAPEGQAVLFRTRGWRLPEEAARGRWHLEAEVPLDVPRRGGAEPALFYFRPVRVV